MSQQKVGTLEVREMSFRYGPRSSFQFERFSVDFLLGRTSLLMGRNGSGKSTLLKLIGGILESDSSRQTQHPRNLELQFLDSGTESRTVVFDQKDPDSLRAWTQEVVYLPSQLKTEFPLTVKEVVELGGRLNRRNGKAERESSGRESVVEESLRRAGCDTWTHRDFMSLSGGERQLVGMARALAQGGRVLLLDESFSQMDLHHQYQMGQLLQDLNRQGIGVILVSHDLNFGLRWADHVVVIDSGQLLASGKKKEVLTETLLKRLYPRVPLGLEVSAVDSSGENIGPQVIFR